MPDPSAEQAAVDEAIGWLIQTRFSTPTPDVQQAFQAWLISHPRHPVVWQRVERMSDEFSVLPEGVRRTVIEKGSCRIQGRRRVLKALVLGGAMVGSGWLTLRQFPGLTADRSTATGEQRLVSLPRGGQVRLNTQTAIDLDLGDRVAKLVLRQGEIAFEAGQGSDRLIGIETRYGALLTQRARLLIRERDNGVWVALRAGKATLLGTGQVASKTLAAGDSLILSRAGTIAPARQDLDPWGWTDGVLTVNRMPLGDFLDELGRYRSGFIQCADDVRHLQVSGTFQLANVDQVLRLVARTLGLNVRYRTRYWVHVEAEEKIG